MAREAIEESGIGVIAFQMYFFAAFALLAAFLNAAFGICLGCEAYLAIRRLRLRS